MEYIIYSVEDDKNIAHIINVTLKKQGYFVDTFYDGRSFFEALSLKKPNMILLDMMLPDISGQEILKNLRSKREYDNVVIIIISANRLTIDKVDGLDLGADDYIEKPFDILELMSRVNAHVRRYKRNRTIQIGKIVLDLDKHSCTKDNDELKLTVKEFEILELLFTSHGNVVTREDLLKKIWGQEAALESRTVDMHVKSLRQKIGDDEANFIVTVYGIGYKVNV